MVARERWSIIWRLWHTSRYSPLWLEHSACSQKGCLPGCHVPKKLCHSVLCAASSDAQFLISRFLPAALCPAMLSLLLGIDYDNAILGRADLSLLLLTSFAGKTLETLYLKGESRAEEFQLLPLRTLINTAVTLAYCSWSLFALESSFFMYYVVYVSSWNRTF